MIGLFILGLSVFHDVCYFDKFYLSSPKVVNSFDENKPPSRRLRMDAWRNSIYFVVVTECLSWLRSKPAFDCGGCCYCNPSPRVSTFPAQHHPVARGATPHHLGRGALRNSPPESADLYSHLRLDTGGACLQPQGGVLTQPRPTAWVCRRLVFEP